MFRNRNWNQFLSIAFEVKLTKAVLSRHILSSSTYNWLKVGSLESCLALARENRTSHIGPEMLKFSDNWRVYFHWYENYLTEFCPRSIQGRDWSSIEWSIWRIFFFEKRNQFGICPEEIWKQWQNLRIDKQFFSMCG